MNQLVLSKTRKSVFDKIIFIKNDVILCVCITKKKKNKNKKINRQKSTALLILSQGIEIFGVFLVNNRKILIRIVAFYS